jgi:hypothetical protein
MKFLPITCFVAFSLACPALCAQGFVNLDFEDATISPTPFTGVYTATVSGWGLNNIPYNTFALDASSVNLEGTDAISFRAIEGNYSIFMQGGSSFFPYTNGISIGQTGQIPLSARSLTYWGNSFVVTFNGQTLPLVAILTTPTYIVWAADISAYAGQTGELRFKAPYQYSGMLDNIQFSSSVIPEPSILGLLALGGFCFNLRGSNFFPSQRHTRRAQ